MFNPNEHMMKLKGKDYLQVAWRLVWFRDPENGCGPTWGIKTELLEHGDNWAVFRATITNEKGDVISTGHGSESAKDFGDYLEKAETKAVGRALAMLGFGTQFAADIADHAEQLGLGQHALSVTLGQRADGLHWVDEGAGRFSRTYHFRGVQFQHLPQTFDLSGSPLRAFLYLRACVSHDVQEDSA